MKELQVGIFGLGTVGSGTVDILTNNKEIIQTSTTTPVRVKTVCVKDTSKQRKVNLHGSKLTSDPNDILDDPEIDIVVEVMGGIEYSKSVIEQAFKKGKHVVSANKDLIALYGKELTDMARKHNCHFFFEAAVAGGIPILRALQFSLIGNQEGIFAEPGSAASLAGIIQSVEKGEIKKGSRVVCILTGNGLKDPDTCLIQVQKPKSIPADISSVLNLLKG